MIPKVMPRLSMSYTLTQIRKNNMILNLPVLVDKLWYYPQDI